MNESSHPTASPDRDLCIALNTADAAITRGALCRLCAALDVWRDLPMRPADAVLAARAARLGVPHQPLRRALTARARA
ncbi:MAG: hypothetical protein AAF772_17635, partial [Acidobacteriota bacterium]